MPLRTRPRRPAEVLRDAHDLASRVRAGRREFAFQSLEAVAAFFLRDRARRVRRRFLVLLILTKHCQMSQTFPQDSPTFGKVT